MQERFNRAIRSADKGRLSSCNAARDQWRKTRGNNNFSMDDWHCDRSYRIANNVVLRNKMPMAAFGSDGKPWTVAISGRGLSVAVIRLCERKRSNPAAPRPVRSRCLDRFACARDDGGSRQLDLKSLFGS